MRRNSLVLIVAVSAAAVVSAQAPAPANTGGNTVWDGVYTAAQAARGLRQYDMTCRSCHEDGPRSGEAFMRDWQGTGLEQLFDQLKKTMPAGAPASLSDAAYRDLVSYILQVNAFPAGGSELSADTVGRIRIEGRNGPEPVPNYALVQVVGCLVVQAPNAWTLSHASEPVRTKEPASSTGDELKTSTATPLGAAAFRLLNVYPRPDAYAGHKVEAKGFLIRDPAGDRLNVTSVQSLAPACPQ